MEQLSGQVAVITGASSGVGAATAVELATFGILVIGLARRTSLIHNLNNQLPSGAPRIHSIYCDVTKLNTILEAFELVEKKYGRINILINCAGIARVNTILGHQSNPTSNFELQNVVNTNLMGSIYTTRTAFPIMDKNENSAQIIQISSHRIPTDEKYVNFRNTYPSSKFGINALGEVIRSELNALNNTRIKYTTISPRLVKTNLFKAAGFDFSDDIFTRAPHLQPKDIADNILYILSLPKNVVIPELAIAPVSG